MVVIVCAVGGVALTSIFLRGGVLFWIGNASSSSESVSISEFAMESNDVLEWCSACFVKRRVGGGVRGLRFGRSVS